jgi:hypothetical protein
MSTDFSGDLTTEQHTESSCLKVVTVGKHGKRRSDRRTKQRLADSPTESVTEAAFVPVVTTPSEHALVERKAAMPVSPAADRSTQFIVPRLVASSTLQSPVCRFFHSGYVATHRCRRR